MCLSNNFVIVLFFSVDAVQSQLQYEEGKWFQTQNLLKITDCNILSVDDCVWVCVFCVFCWLVLLWVYVLTGAWCWSTILTTS